MTISKLLTKNFDREKCLTLFALADRLWLRCDWAKHYRLMIRLICVVCPVNKPHRECLLPLKELLVFLYALQT